MKPKQFLSCCLAVLLLAALCSGCAGKNTSSPEQDAESSSREGLSLPCELEDGALQVQSVFPSDVMNPDCGGEYAEGVATLEVRNCSEDYLSRAEISVELADGALLSFAVTDLPAGETIWAFSTDNSSVGLQPQLKDISCTAEFESETPAAPEIDIAVDDTRITLTNRTGADIADAAVLCHCRMDEVLFGGVTYTYHASLAAGESAVIEAEDCVLGIPEIVRIRVDS